MSSRNARALRDAFRFIFSLVPAELRPVRLRPSGGEPAGLQREGCHLWGDAYASTHVSERAVNPFSITMYTHSATPTIECQTFFFSALDPKKWVSHKIKTCCSYSEASSQAVAPLRSALTSLNPVYALCSLSCCWAVWCCCGKLLPPGACHAWLTVMLGRVDRVRNVHLNTRTRWIPVRCSVFCRGFNVVAAHNVSFISAFSDTSEVLMRAVFLNFIYFL